MIFALGCVETPQESKSARVTIDLVNHSWIDYGSLIEGKEGAGAFYSIKVFVENTGTMPMNPEYGVTISYEGSKISSQNVSSSLISSIAPKERKRDDLMLNMVRIDEKGSYEVNINLMDRGSAGILGSASKIVKIG